MKFADIPGHDNVKQRLRMLVDSDHIPHAMLLEGPPGAGKFMLARALAQYIHCENRTADGDSCGVCQACQQHQSFNHIDTFYSFPVVKKGGKPTVSDDYIDRFRQYIGEYPFMDFERWLEKLDNINAQPAIYVEEGLELLRRLSYMTRRSKYKVVLLWLPERLREETANKLLKLVEEPHADTVFVMVSNNPRQILPTIYSRTQRIGVKRYSDQEIAAILRDKNVADTAADDIARIAEGNVNEALRLCGVSEARVRYLELFASLMRLAYQRKVAALRDWASEVASMGREPAMQFLEYSARLLRENFILHTGRQELITLNEAEMKFCSRFFPYINERNVLRFFEEFNAAVRDIGGNANSRIVLFDFAVKTIILLRK